MDALRIIDANINRTREALRVIEEYARFALDDRDAAETLKRCRHDLRLIMDAIGPDALLAARDIAGDVGKEIKTDRELRRDSTTDVAQAAFVRLSEAARVLGEYGKLISPDVARAAEQLRYRTYGLQQQIILRGTTRQRLRGTRLYVLITARLCRQPWEQVLEATIDGGAGCVQLREKQLDDAELLRRARLARAITARRGVLLAINDRPDIARLAKADIVHVGQDDFPVAEVRRIAGGDILVGKSTHTLEQLELALAEEPDYIAVGPIFASATKPQDHIAGLDALAEARSRTKLPLVAIGGITADRAAAVTAAGADCLAVCAAVSAVKDVAAATRAFLTPSDGSAR